MHILAAVSRSPTSPPSVERLEIPEPKDHEVLVKVTATGLCHTDLVAHDGLLPTQHPVVLGHEGAGEVIRIGGAVRDFRVGDKVVMSYASCGLCASCTEGATSYCHHFRRLNFTGHRLQGGEANLTSDTGLVHAGFFGQSSFATYAICHERNLVAVPADLELRTLGPLGCGIQTGAGAIINSLQVKAGASVAIFGAGAVGLSAVMAARVVGATRIIVIDPIAQRRQLAQEFGATHTIDANNPSVVETILRESAGGVNYALDTTGLPAVIRQGVDVLAIRGICGVLGASAPGALLELPAGHIMSGGRSLRGIVEGDAKPADFIPYLLALHRQGKLPFERMLAFYPLDRIQEAFEDSRAGRTIKAVIEMPVSE